jgi:predicted transcriptional regulator
MDTRSRWNETTKAILAALSKQPRTVMELAQALGCGRTNVTVPLLKLLRRGCVDREVDVQGVVVLRQLRRGSVERANKVYVYYLTDAGKDRLKTIKTGQRGD